MGLIPSQNSGSKHSLYVYLFQHRFEPFPELDSCSTVSTPNIQLKEFPEVCGGGKKDVNQTTGNPKVVQRYTTCIIPIT